MYFQGDFPDDASGDRLERDGVLARRRLAVPGLRLLPHLRTLPLQQHRHVHLHRQVKLFHIGIGCVNVTNSDSRNMIFRPDVITLNL